jgi:uncharacterized protein (TIGR02246 family)
MKPYLFLIAIHSFVIAPNSVFAFQAAKVKEVAPQKTAVAGNPSDAELDAIRKGSLAFADAFNRQDAKAIASMWTVDGEYIDEAGNQFQGRVAIEKEYADFFEKGQKAKLTVMIDSLRILSPTTAIEDGRTLIEATPAGTPSSAAYVAVHSKVDGKWLMASVRDTSISIPPVNHVADLEWMVGTWVAEEHGIKTVSVCRWLGNKSFLERVYTTTALDGTTSSGMQLIGWNPLEGNVQSWNFSPDGGHSLGVWNTTDKGWTADMFGFTGAGAVTTSINTIARLDDNAYVWQSMARTLNGIPLPDSDEIILKRTSANR